MEQHLAIFTNTAPRALHDATPILHGNTALINGTASCHCTTVVNTVP